MQEKVFTDYDQQIELLRSRGLVIDDVNFAKSLLSKTSYYSLINGYQAPFLDPENKNAFIKGARIEEIDALYSFDHAIMPIMFYRIISIENQVKAVLSHEFSRKYGHKNYLKYENFCVRKPLNDEGKILRLISSIQSELARNVAYNNSVRHYLTKYGYVPFWILVKMLSLGTIAKFYELLHDELKHAIASSFSLKPDTMETLLRNLTLFRNVCAHSNRLYCYRTHGPIPALLIHDFLDIPIGEDGNHKYGKQDLLSLLIMITTFLDGAAPYLVDAMQGFFEILKDGLVSIPCEKIMGKMGLFDGWEKLSEYSRQSKDKE